MNLQELGLGNIDLRQYREHFNEQQQYREQAAAHQQRARRPNPPSVESVKVNREGYKMPPAISAVLSFIPTNIWKMIKKFVKAEKVVTFDTPFKISTKYTPALIIIIMCLSFANQFFRNIEIDCTSSTDTPSSGSSGRGGGYGGGSESELNNYCWNYETFLVAKALEPRMRGKVTYPGIWSYVRGEDELVKQKYYKYLWFGLAKIAVVAFFPLFLWKLKGIADKIKSLTEVGHHPTEDEQDATRAAYFIETVGFNQGLAAYYFFCKVLALLTPLFNWLYLSGFIGKQYRLYGVEVLMFIMDGGDPWPNPMDALFPKIAKCEWAKYGYTGDLEVKAAQCQLPMNNFTQWSFFFLWWWIIFVLFINLMHFFYFVFFVFPLCRKYTYRRFVAKVCREDIEMARTYTVLTSRGKETKSRSINKIISLKIAYGDWFMLYFLEKNLVDYQFRSFIRKLAVTANPVLQLKPPEQNYSDAITAHGLPGAPLPGPNDEPMANPNNQIGFMESMLKGAPPNYVSCDESDSTLSTVGCEADEGARAMAMPPGPPKMGFTFELPPETPKSFTISRPIKVDRQSMSKLPSHSADGKGGMLGSGGSAGMKSRAAPAKPPIRPKPKFPKGPTDPYQRSSSKPGHNSYGMDEENWD